MLLSRQRALEKPTPVGWSKDQKHRNERQEPGTTGAIMSGQCEWSQIVTHALQCNHRQAGAGIWGFVPRNRNKVIDQFSI
jgi:hypothetical protein